ncbi:hypothetical protein M1B72_04865 [Geomonas paludis]|uniref:Uncharacterized protein n=1 Tax=Geomonas paludis TaxID=2740185 RepID=A0A6V8MYF2_9BACT|nr:hypothetical protein [Geomonas paludis]UPU37042.1 hypothetical protein M1B72_04865 [Geomonas paludis]GFO64864.1 hypothetical protein GMPD_27830 [Geomonas paludis]
MSNIFDALEQARRERHKDDPPSPDVVGGGRNNNSNIADSVSASTIDAEIAEMFVRFEEQLKGPGLVMQLISSHLGEGVSSVAQRFASVSSTLLDKKVLLVKLLECVVATDNNLPAQLKWQEVLSDNQGSDFSVQKRGGVTEVCVLFDLCSKQLKEDPNVLSKTKSMYDIIIFDMPSVAAQPHGVELTRYADIVVIILESEKTKLFALQSLKEKITHNSDAFVGVVLNKRCFHIPDRLYAKLH